MSDYSALSFDARYFGPILSMRTRSRRDAAVDLATGGMIMTSSYRWQSVGLSLC
jgi:hypothetical protein